MMDEKMKAALQTWVDRQWAERKYIPSPQECVEWTLEYLRNQQEPAIWLGTKLVPYEERVFHGGTGREEQCDELLDEKREGE